MKITKRWIQKWKPSPEFLEWLKTQTSRDAETLIKKLVKEDRLYWASWVIVRCLSTKDRIRYAVYAAEQVIDLYEAKYSDGVALAARASIEAAKRVIKQNTKKNRDDARIASRAAVDAAIYAPSDAGVCTAYAAMRAAMCAAVFAVADAAECAADAAVDAEDSKPGMLKKTIVYGLRLLRSAS